MAFESLSERFQAAFKKLRGKGKLSEEDVSEALKEMRRALLEADVNFAVTKDFIKRVREKAVGEEVFGSLNASQTVIKIVRDELAELLGGTQSRIAMASKPPTIIMLVGLQGAGKTTTAAKLAKKLRAQGKNPLLVAADVYRPAAITQLQVMGQDLDIPVYTEDGSKDPVAISQHAIPYALSHLKDVVIIDTAGRLHVNETLMDELVHIKEQVKPHEILLVVDAMTGQDAVNTAKEFNERLDFDGVVLTKLDGDTRGGAALSIRSVVNKPIKFVGTGEKLDAIDQFHPARMADRILGMGDIVSLVERAQEQYDEEEAKRLQKKIAKNQFDFNDFLSQIGQIKKMGNLKELASMIPGVGKAIKDIDIDDNAFKSIEAIIYSMTPEERSNPAILNGSRRTRIAKGSGTTIQEVNRLLKQFDQTRKMMKMVTSSKMGKMMPKMK